MSLYTKIMNYLLWKLVYLLPNRTYIIYTDGNKYLLRVYLKHKGIMPEIFLHHFYASDSDRDLHNHPFRTSASFILTGAYKETRLSDDKINTYNLEYKAGNVNIIKANDYHQIQLATSPIWTLFFAGKRIQKWGFWNIEKQVFIPWDEYVELNNNSVRDLEGNLTKLPAE